MVCIAIPNSAWHIKDALVESSKDGIKQYFGSYLRHGGSKCSGLYTVDVTWLFDASRSVYAKRTAAAQFDYSSHLAGNFTAAQNPTRLPCSPTMNTSWRAVGGGTQVQHETFADMRGSIPILDQPVPATCCNFGALHWVPSAADAHSIVRFNGAHNALGFGPLPEEAAPLRVARHDVAPVR
eukprot:365734-Chlamydomonas_euryale.AAC.6